MRKPTTRERVKATMICDPFRAISPIAETGENATPSVMPTMMPMYKNQLVRRCMRKVWMNVLMW